MEKTGSQGGVQNDFCSLAVLEIDGITVKLVTEYETDELLDDIYKWTAGSFSFPASHFASTALVQNSNT
jgi:hypothetical protein